MILTGYVVYFKNKTSNQQCTAKTSAVSTNPKLASGNPTPLNRPRVGNKTSGTAKQEAEASLNSNICSIRVQRGHNPVPSYQIVNRVWIDSDPQQECAEQGRLPLAESGRRIVTCLSLGTVSEERATPATRANYVREVPV